MSDVVERIAHILGNSRSAGGLSDHDVALNIARELGVVPHDPLPHDPPQRRVAAKPDETVTHDPPQKAEERRYTPSDSPLMQQSERRAAAKPDETVTSGGRATKAKEA
jgi:hypothetical protein